MSPETQFWLEVIKTLGSGIPEHQKQIELQKQAIQSLGNEIQAITNSLDELAAAWVVRERILAVARVAAPAVAAATSEVDASTAE
jgi:hypothetical protein